MKYCSDQKEQAFVCRHRGNEALVAAFETGEVYAMLIGKVFCKCGDEEFVAELPTPEETLAAGDRANPGDVPQANILLSRSAAKRSGDSK